MTEAKMNLTDPQYAPCQFIDNLKVQLGIKTDLGLSRKIGIARPIISKIRNRKLSVGPTFLLAAHEATGLPTKEIKSWMSAAEGV